MKDNRLCVGVGVGTAVVLLTSSPYRMGFSGICWTKSLLYSGVAGGLVTNDYCITHRGLGPSQCGMILYDISY